MSRFLNLQRRRNRVNVLYLLLWIPFFYPDSIKYLFPELAKMLNIACVISMIIIIGLVIIKKRFILSGIVVAITIYCTVYIFSTIVNSGEVYQSILRVCIILVPCFFCDVWIKENTSSFLKSIGIFFTILIFINFISIMMYPSGLYKIEDFYVPLNQTNRWFLGYDNIHITVFLPTIAIILLQNWIQEKKLLNFSIYSLTFILCYISTAISWPAKTVVILIILSAYLFFGRKGLNSTFFNFGNYCIVILFILFMFVVFEAQYLFRGFIENFLGKDLSFNNRTYIWETAWSYIKHKFMFGYGAESIKQIYYKLNHGTTHNLYIWDLYCGGILMLSALVGIIAVVGKRLMHYRNTIPGQLMSIVIFLVLLFWCFEADRKNLLFVTLVIAYNVPIILKEKQNYTSSKETNYPAYSGKVRTVTRNATI